MTNKFLNREYWQDATLECVKKEIANGVEINAQDKDGKTALMLASMNSKDPNIIITLLDHGVDVNAQTKKGYNALMMASCHTTNPDIITTLIEHNSKVNVRSKDGKTALMLASRYNSNPDVVTVLIEQHVYVHARDNEGFTAWDYIQDNKVLKNAQVYEKLKDLHGNENVFLHAEYWQNATLGCLKRDIGKKLGLNEQSQYGTTALMLASRFNKNPEIINILIKNWSDVNARDDEGQTALIIASGFNDNPEVVATLLSHGADVNAQDKEGKTALMFASMFNQNLTIVSTLLSHGADVNAQDKEGKTAVMLTYWFKRNDEIIKMLIANGALAPLYDIHGITALSCSEHIGDTKKENNINDDLNEQNKIYGDFRENAVTAQALKIIIHSDDNWEELSDVARESLDLICGKIARILTSRNKGTKDNWEDIAEYATLAENEFKKNKEI